MRMRSLVLSPGVRCTSMAGRRNSLLEKKGEREREEEEEEGRQRERKRERRRERERESEEKKGEFSQREREVIHCQTTAHAYALCYILCPVSACTAEFCISAGFARAARRA